MAIPTIPNEDTPPLERLVGECLRRRGETLAVAESCTGGWLGQRITRIAGSSGYFIGGVISYANRVKTDVLGVSAADLARQGAVSEPVARAMAVGVAHLLATTWGLSITGVAGPAAEPPDPLKPVGLVFIALAGMAFVEVKELRLGERPRDDIRWASTDAALDLLWRRIR